MEYNNGLSASISNITSGVRASLGTSVQRLSSERRIRPAGDDADVPEIGGYDAPSALKNVKAALNPNEIKGPLGATIDRLRNDGKAHDAKTNTILAAESNISDVDAARKVGTLTAARVQIEAAVALQSQANSTNDAALALLCR